jgi:quercetin dioxygenase-like cupin family protein
MSAVVQLATRGPAAPARPVASAELRWAVQDEPVTGACVGLLDLEAGHGGSIAPVAGAERVVLVLDGEVILSTTDRDLVVTKETLVMAPGGSRLSVRATAPARVLTVQARSSRSPTEPMDGIAAPPSPEDRARVVRFEDAPAVPVHAPELGLNHMISRTLTDSDVLRTTSVHIGHSTFAARGRGHHPLHRHPAAGQFICLLAGRGAHAAEDGEVSLTAGDLVYIPAGEWHGFRSVGDEPAELIYGYLGVSSTAAAGLELKCDPTRAETA